MTAPVRWGDLDAARLTPPAVADPRGRAIVETVAALLREGPLTRFLLTDPATVIAAALPALIAAAGISDLIEPGLPEAEARALLAEAVPINAARGRVAGIRRGLALVGLDADVVQWHQTTPKGAPNTYEITVWAERQVIPEEGGPLVNDATQRQARRIVDAMKRWSQDGPTQFGIATRPEMAVAGAVTVVLLVAVDCLAAEEMIPAPSIAVTGIAGEAVEIEVI